MKTQKKKIEKRIRLKAKIRSRIFGTAEMPRLSVFRSNMHVYVQAIDDNTQKTIASASDLLIKKGTKAERSQEVGKAIAKALLDQKITKVVFDRNGFKYTGRVKMVADAARSAGLEF